MKVNNISNNERLQGYRRWVSYLEAKQRVNQKRATKQDIEVTSEYEKTMNQVIRNFHNSEEVEDYCIYFYSEYTNLVKGNLYIARELSHCRKVIVNLEKIVREEKRAVQPSTGTKYRVQVWEKGKVIGYIKAVFREDARFSITTNTKYAKQYTTRDKVCDEIDYCTRCNSSYGYIFEEISE